MERVSPGVQAENEELAALISGTFGTTGEFRDPRQPRHYMYWHKCARENCRKHTNRDTGANSAFNYVTIGSSRGTRLEYDKMIDHKHAEPLPQYGEIGIGPKEPGSQSTLRFHQIIKMGGINEFPRQQIIDYNWDRWPLIAKFRPDVIEGLERFPCTYGCDRPAFHKAEHLTQHIMLRHQEAAGGDMMGVRLSDGITEVGKIMAEGRKLDNDQFATVLGGAFATMLEQSLPSIIKAVQTGSITPTPAAEVPFTPPVGPTMPGESSGDAAPTSPETTGGDVFPSVS